MSSNRRSKSEREAILARRKIFIVTALAGLATTECKNPFRPCLEVEPVDSGASVPPTPCLSPPPMPMDAQPPKPPSDGGDR